MPAQGLEQWFHWFQRVWFHWFQYGLQGDAGGFSTLDAQLVDRKIFCK